MIDWPKNEDNQVKFRIKCKWESTCLIEVWLLFGGSHGLDSCIQLRPLHLGQQQKEDRGCSNEVHAYYAEISKVG